MPVKLRLQRHGRKKKPFYHIVAADSRSPRDGRFIERVGSYNPMTDPSEVVVDIEKALKWLQNGAIPTEKVRGLLSREGVLYKNHLQTGVRKGAITQEQADEKFAAWVAQKEARLGVINENLRKSAEAQKAARLAAEKEAFNKRAAAMAAVSAVEEPAVEAEPSPDASAEDAAEPTAE
jgi:small subunit ribosomal protein S16